MKGNKKESKGVKGSIKGSEIATLTVCVDPGATSADLARTLNRSEPTKNRRVEWNEGQPGTR